MLAGSNARDSLTTASGESDSARAVESIPRAPQGSDRIFRGDAEPARQGVADHLARRGERSANRFQLREVPRRDRREASRAGEIAAPRHRLCWLGTWKLPAATRKSVNRCQDTMRQHESRRNIRRSPRAAREVVRRPRAVNIRNVSSRPAPVIAIAEDAENRGRRVEGQVADDLDRILRQRIEIGLHESPASTTATLGSPGWVLRRRSASS